MTMKLSPEDKIDLLKKEIDIDYYDNSVTFQRKVTYYKAQKLIDGNQDEISGLKNFLAGKIIYEIGTVHL